jgi:hypothetical protein
MQMKQLKRTLETLGLTLHAHDGNFSNSANIRVKAPDGTVRKFQISRVDDPDSDRTNITQLRHFARDHSHSLPLPGVVQADVLNVTHKPMGALEYAMAAVTQEHNPMAKAFFKAHLADKAQAPISLDNLIVNTASKPVDPPPAPPAPSPKKTMPSNTLKAVTMQKKPTERKSPKTIDRIGQVEFFKLCTTLNEMDMIGIDTMTKLSEKLTKAFGRKISVSTAEDALKATGKKLDKVQVEVTDAQSVIARTLTALLIKLSEPVPEELRRLCGEIE